MSDFEILTFLVTYIHNKDMANVTTERAYPVRVMRAAEDRDLRFISGILLWDSCPYLRGVCTQMEPANIYRSSPATCTDKKIIES